MKSIAAVYKIAILALAFAAATSPLHASAAQAFTIENDSDAVVYHLYVSRHGASSWGNDVLGNDVLRPGEYMNVSFPDGSWCGGTCEWDIGVVYEDGSTAAGTFDLCLTEVVQIH